MKKGEEKEEEEKIPSFKMYKLVHAKVHFVFGKL